jgi:hypothetical protein
MHMYMHASFISCDYSLDLITQSDHTVMGAYE